MKKALKMYFYINNTAQKTTILSLIYNVLDDETNIKINQR